MDTVTQRTFDRIAELWHSYSFKKRPLMEILEWTRNIKGKIVLDLGSGTGRHTEPLAQENTVIAIDFSNKMLSLNRYTDYKIQADMTSIPLKDNTIDIVLAIASIHHLKSEERVKCLSEINRVLKPDGEGLISVWHRDQERFKNVPTSGDVIVPWKVGDASYLRFYHLFTLPELERSIKNSNLNLENIYLDTMKRNIFAKVKKGS